jgi:hypothetical protein
MQTWLLICTYGSCAALVAVFAVMFAIPSARTIGWVVLIVMAVGLTLFGVLGVRWWGWNKKIRICVTSDDLTVDKKPGEVFSFKDAKLGVFTVGQAMALSGTAMALSR